ncbi:MAG: MFS transporter [Acidimicrobiia bacterium]|nr:MFS transporter [Acidimicrobiia bacterium]
MTTVTALGKQVYDLTGRELDLGLLGLAEFAPAALLVLVTGSVADRFDRRRVMAISGLCEGGCALLIAWYVHTGRTAVAPIFAIVVCFGVARAFNSPASRSLPADVVGAEHLPWLVARNSMAFQVALIVGPVLAGSLYAVDHRLPYLAVAALTLVSASATFFIALQPRQRAPRAERRPGAMLHDALAGLRVVRRQPILLGVISLDLFAVLFGGAIALLPALAEDRLGVGSVGFGWLRAAGGIGAAAVMLGLARRPVTRHVGRTLLVAVGAFGLFTVVLGLTRTFAVAFVAMVALTGADAVSVFIRGTLVPLAVTAETRGRVLAVEAVFIGASNELGAFESGVAGELLGPAGAVVLGGLATVAVAVGWWALFPSLRRVDRFRDVVAAVPADRGPGPTSNV